MLYTAVEEKDSLHTYLVKLVIKIKNLIVLKTEIKII